MEKGPDHNTTENDEFIARALAEQEEEEAAAARTRRLKEQARQPTQNLNNCQGASGSNLPTGFSSPSSGQRSNPPSPIDYAPPSRQPRSTPQQPFAFSGNSRRRVPMCHIPCVAVPNSVCVEMMVDTGAESSIISEQLAKELGLYPSMDRSQQGIATGVGQARIVGQIRDAVVTLGHVDFIIEFLVLQVPGRLMLLGLDQMRKYKCIVDLEKDVLIFGGSGGVEVAMLPPDKQRHFLVPPGIGGGCTIS